MPARPITPALFIRQHVLRMTVGEFAKALDVDKSQASRYDERGQIPGHHRDTVRRLARARGVSLPAVWFEQVPFDRSVRSSGVV